MVKKSLLRFTPAILWMAVIFFLSQQGSDSSDQQSGVFVTLLTPIAGNLDLDALTTIVRKSAHFSAYLILGVLFFWAFRPHITSIGKTAGISIATAALFALSDEFHQSFVPGRSAELRDVLLDTLGAATGVALVWLILHLYRRNTIIRTDSAETASKSRR